MMRFMKLALLLTSITFLFGCASGAKMENMVYKPAEAKQYDTALSNQVSVDQVSGGKETNPALASQISDTAFQAALKQSLDTEGLLSEDGNYRLTATILSVDQPIMGFDMTVTTHVKYTLKDKASDSIVFEDTLHAPYTATVGDAFAGIARLRMANEGSGKKNIEMLLDKLSEFQVSPEQVSISQ